MSALNDIEWQATRLGYNGHAYAIKIGWYRLSDINWLVELRRRLWP